MVGARVARAADPSACGSSRRPWIQVVLTSDFPAAVAPFVDLLRVELTSRGFDLCSARAQDQREPIATIEVVPKPGVVALNVEVRDAVTKKRVSRDIDLGAIPPDGQPLTVALAADELLRASWAELALRSAPPPAEPVPAAVVQVLRESVLQPAGSDRFRLGIVVTGEHYAAGTTLYGADARLDVALTRRLSVGLGFGLRTGAAVTGADGEVATSALAGTLSTAFTLTPPGRAAGLDGVARFGADRLSFTPTPHPAALGTAEAGYALFADVGVEVWIRVARRLRVGTEILAAVPMRRVYVTDAQVRVAGVAGVGLSAGLGAWSTF
jgi:hypothetical protein